MADFNRVLIMGRLTRDLDLRYTGSGSAVADFNLAINRSYTTTDGTARRETCFVDVTVWRSLAEKCKENLKKGSPVFVEGRLHLDTWKGPSGEKRNKLRVIAETVKFLGREEENKQDGGEKKDSPDKFEF
jgi:single-strand DNA-binding protein